MLENKNRFYLYDRWFYLLKETEEKLTYTSVVKDSSSGILIEIEKETNDMSILYFEQKVLIAKLDITDTNSKNIKLHYQDQEPQQIIINDNVYVNLLLELYTNIENDKLNSKKMVIINRMRKFDKEKRMCYCEPTFPIDKEVDLKTLDIESDVFNYFLELIDYIKSYIKSIDKITKEEEKVVEPLPLKTSINKLVIPEELYIYDRNYKFVGKDEKTIYYENHEDCINNLELKLDPNKYLSSINFIFEEKGIKNSKMIFQIIRNELNGVTIKFYNHKKSQLRVSGKEYKNYDNAKFINVITYDEKRVKTFSNLEIKADQEEYNLTQHPYFTNTYIDEYGNEYRISSQDFAKLDNMTSYAPGIFTGIEEQLIKKI